MTTKVPANVRLLLVDDEDNILRSLQRVLRREPYTLFTAASGPDALAIMEQERIDLVISDARMPGMDGPSLLTTIRSRWPWCVRILLTGYADMTATTRAINEGRIYRYISKPWDDDELKVVIRQALAFQYSERRRLKLEKVTRQQNQELQNLNASLEQKVEERTTELRQTADMLDRAYAELKRGYVTTTEVFSTLINQRLPHDARPNARVIALAKAFADDQGLGEEASRDLAMAAALYNIGKISWPDQLLATPSDQLSLAQGGYFRSYPGTGEQLLMALEPLQGAAHLIRHHQERWNGRGFPDQLSADGIPLGARILRLAVDFIELQCGLILGRRLPRDEAMEQLNRHSGRIYDPGLCEAFITLCQEAAPDTTVAGPGVLALETNQLQPGMVLASNLHAASGMLLLNNGKVLSAFLINKLIAFERGEPEGTRYTLYIHAPDEPDTETGT